MSRNRHIHVYLKEEVTEYVITTEEAENPDDSGSEEDPDYVANGDNSEFENSRSEFEDSGNDYSDREGLNDEDVIEGGLGRSVF
ncbi:hypothetical protein V6N13_109972 [Hibiscus sabdariffa]